jgi:hypothetical protein
MRKGAEGGAACVFCESQISSTSLGALLLQVLSWYLSRRIQLELHERRGALGLGGAKMVACRPGNGTLAVAVAAAANCKDRI